MDGYNIYNIVLIAIFSVVILGIFLGAEKKTEKLLSLEIMIILDSLF